MDYYLVPCRSLTYAQRTAAVLERAGITVSIQRTPKGLAKEGCGHSVRVPAHRIWDSLELLRRAGLTPKKLYHRLESGAYQEVGL